MKKTILFIITIMITTLISHANQEPIKTEFTVTQIALDAANEKEAQEALAEEQNISIESIQPKGGDTEKK
jgi:hypothetical protein